MIVSRVGMDAMVAWCRHGVPLEACGLLGAHPEDEARVVHLWPCANAAQSTHHFRIAQAELASVIAGAIQAGLVVIGAWHSHLGSPAVPSKADLAMAPYPRWVHVIVSLAQPQPDVRAWQGNTELEMIVDD